MSISIPSPETCLLKTSKRREEELQYNINLWIPRITPLCETYSVDSVLPLTTTFIHVNVVDFTDKLQEMLVIKFKEFGWDLRFRPTFETSGSYSVVIAVKPSAPIIASNTTNTQCQ